MLKSLSSRHSSLPLLIFTIHAVVSCAWHVCAVCVCVYRNKTRITMNNIFVDADWKSSGRLNNVDVNILEYEAMFVGCIASIISTVRFAC